MSSASYPSEFFDNSIWPFDLPVHLDQLDTGLFVLDTNVLLDFHRTPNPSQRKLWFDLLYGIRDRMWIPYQVRLEYLKNRLSVRKQHEAQVGVAANNAKRRSNAFLAGIWKDTRQLRAPLDPLPGMTAAYTAVCDTMIDNLTAALWHRYEGNVVPEIDRIIAQDVEKLIAGRTGEEPSPEQLKRWKNESAERHKNKVAPSWAEHRKGGSDELHGDFIILMQMAEHARDSDHRGQPVVFVTNDRKPTGWMEHVAGVPVGAHSQCVKDMDDIAGVPFLVIGPHHLLQYVSVPTQATLVHEFDWGDDMSEDRLDTLPSILLNQDNPD